MKEKQTHNKHSFAKPENENISDEVKKIIEHHSEEYEQWAYRLKTNIRHTTAVMAVLLLAFVLYCVVPNPVSDAPLQPTATVAQQSRPPEALQSSTSLLAAQTTDIPVTDTPILHHHDDKPATITDNEIKNTADHTTNKYNHTRYAENEPATPQPDIIATAPIEQEHIPVLLAETETQIEIEQNLVAIDTAIDNINVLHTDTILQLQKDLPKYETNYLAYIDDTNNTNLIPDISNTNTNEDLCSLNMITYCNIRCSNNNITEMIIEGVRI